MATKTDLNARLEFRRTALIEARKAYLALLEGGVKSYAIGSRNLTKFDLPELEATISKYEKEIDALEAELNGRSRRRAVGVVPRDW